MSGWHALASQLPFEWARYAFMQNALLAVLVMGPLFALLGCMVVNKQMAFFSESVGHATLTGIALGVILGLRDPLWSMLAVAVLLALGVSLLRRHSAASADTVIGLAMAFAVAVGVAVLSRGGGFAKYQRYLIGDVLTITPAELARLAILLAGVAVVWIALFNPLFLVSLHAPLARSRGIRVALLEALFSVVVAVAVTVSIQWVGLLVINSMLILPAAAARNIARDTPRFIALSVAVSVLSGVLGLVGSFYWGTATGATIVLVAMGFFAVSVGLRALAVRV